MLPPFSSVLDLSPTSSFLVNWGPLVSLEGPLSPAALPVPDRLLVFLSGLSLGGGLRSCLEQMQLALPARAAQGLAGRSLEEGTVASAGGAVVALGDEGRVALGRGVM